MQENENFVVTFLRILPRATLISNTSIPIKNIFKIPELVGEFSRHSSHYTVPTCPSSILFDGARIFVLESTI